MSTHGNKHITTSLCFSLFQTGDNSHAVLYLFTLLKGEKTIKSAGSSVQHENLFSFLLSLTGDLNALRVILLYHFSNGIFINGGLEGGVTNLLKTLQGNNLQVISVCTISQAFVCLCPQHQGERTDFWKLSFSQ